MKKICSSCTKEFHTQRANKSICSKCALDRNTSNTFKSREEAIIKKSN